MIVLKYFDCLSTLKSFNLVSSRCDEAIRATKLNPNYGADTLDTLFQGNEVTNVQKELQIFENIQTLQISSDCLEEIYKTQEKYIKESIELIKITDFVLKEKNSQLNGFLSLQNKIVELKLDCDYFIPGLNLSLCRKLKTLTLRIGNVFKMDCLNKYINEIKTIPYLKLICIFHSKNHEIVLEIVKEFPRIKLVCCWMDQNTSQQLLNLTGYNENHVIGVSHYELKDYTEFDKLPFILLPKRNGFLEFANEMVVHQYFNGLLNKYYPASLEIIGKKSLIVSVQNETKVDLSWLGDLKKLSLYDSKTKNLKYILPSNITELRIVNFATKDDFINFGEMKQKLKGNCSFLEVK